MFPSHKDGRTLRRKSYALNAMNRTCLSKWRIKKPFITYTRAGAAKKAAGCGGEAKGDLIILSRTISCQPGAAFRSGVTHMYAYVHTHTRTRTYTRARAYTPSHAARNANALTHVYAFVMEV